MTTHFPSPSLPVGVAPNPWIPFIMVMVTHIVPLECVHFDEYKADNVTLKTSMHTSENASKKYHYFALAFTGMIPVPSRLCELWRQCPSRTFLCVCVHGKTSTNDRVRHVDMVS